MGNCGQVKKQPPYRKTWKDKIDPDFDSIIKTYVQLLKNIEQLPKGYTGLIEESGKSGLNDTWWDSTDPEDKPPDNIKHDEKIAKVII